MEPPLVSGGLPTATDLVDSIMVGFASPPVTTGGPNRCQTLTPRGVVLFPQFSPGSRTSSFESPKASSKGEALFLSMRSIIPTPVISVVSRILPDHYTAEGLDELFVYAGAAGEAPAGSKQARAQAWLRRTNKEIPGEALNVLGKVIEELIDGLSRPEFVERDDQHRNEVLKVLADNSLTYMKGGRIVGPLGAPSRTLEHLITEYDLASIDIEFERAIRSIDESPPDAVSAASNILEIACKVIIEAENLAYPSKEDLPTVWNVTRKHLGLDASKVEDQDLQRIVSGLCSVVGGIGALRTHASSAHGNAHKKYRLEPRHARLAVHSAHTVTMFLVESWMKKKGK